MSHHPLAQPTRLDIHHLGTRIEKLHRERRWLLAWMVAVSIHVAASTWLNTKTRTRVLAIQATCQVEARG